MARASKVQPAAARKAPPNAGKGRRKGVPNKVTADLKDMILGALKAAGGLEYLQERALDPKTAPAFLALLGKVLPMQVTGEGGGPVLTAAVDLAGATPEQLRALASLKLPNEGDGHG